MNHRDEQETGDAVAVAVAVVVGFAVAAVAVAQKSSAAAEKLAFVAPVVGAVDAAVVVYVVEVVGDRSYLRLPSVAAVAAGALHTYDSPHSVAVAGSA